MPPSFVSQATTLVHEEGIITQWFSLHHFPLAKLRHYTLQKLGKPCELVKAAATRFGTNTLVGERLLKLKGSLQATCTDEEYVDKKYVDKTNSEEESGTGRIVRSNKGGTASKLCLDNRASGFWARVASHVHATLPMLKMLRRFDSSAPTIGKLYSSWFELGQHFETTESNFKRQALEKHAERWAYSYADIAGAAYVLDPEFHGHEQHKNQEVMKGFNDAVEKIGILEATWKLVRAAEPEHVARRPPQCLLPLTVLMCATQVSRGALLYRVVPVFHYVNLVYIHISVPRSELPIEFFCALLLLCEPLMGGVRPRRLELPDLLFFLSVELFFLMDLQH